MIATRLKQATHAAHQSLEGMMIPAMKQIHHRQGYAQLLHLFYGYYAPLECLLEPFVGKYLPDITTRRKASLILDDLDALGEGNAAIPQTTVLPNITNAAQAMGALYVLEGSTLGGTHIAQLLQKQLGSDTGLSFFRGYGGETGSKWKTFLEALNAFPANETQEAELVAAANETFNTLKHWTALHYGSTTSHPA